jgi:hypothetical protein
MRRVYRAILNSGNSVRGQEVREMYKYMLTESKSKKVVEEGETKTPDIYFILDKKYDFEDTGIVYDFELIYIGE